MKEDVVAKETEEEVLALANTGTTALEYYEGISAILAANTHLREVYKFELLHVDSKSVRAEIEAELEGVFVLENAPCAVNC